jgi:hypothetical protein
MAFGGCSQDDDANRASIQEALSRIGLDMDAIALPKTQPPGSGKGRLGKVDALMQFPPSAINLGAKLKQTAFVGSRSRYLSQVLASLDVHQGDWDADLPVGATADAVWAALVEAAPGDGGQLEIPSAWADLPLVTDELLPVLAAIADVRRAWNVHGGQPTAVELERIRSHLSQSIAYEGIDIDAFMLRLQTYHQIGKRTNIDALSAALFRLFFVLEATVPRLATAELSASVLEWRTPLGLVRIAGKEDHRHRGKFLLLLDMGGDDVYEDVGSALAPGNVSVVIDLAGNDQVSWKETFGPGSGVLGAGIWWDLDGNDQYEGSNWGLGSALFGSAIFWDEKGDDVYTGGGLILGAGHYGVGFFIDSAGNDRYDADLASQGYGGPGGIGVMVDFVGNDQYSCRGRFPDNFPARIKRHAEEHYFSLCQGYGYGLWPGASGGIGILIDHLGDDSYKADIYSQGGGYFFGLGMLIDGAGNDHYEAFEHSQGDGLHHAAGFLGDWAGNDVYQGYEHVQGIGKDESFGILYDEAGNDIYAAHTESQGTGLNMAGVGILLDKTGDDKYEATSASQGNSIPGFKAPASVAPIGILLDLDGHDTFMLSGSRTVDTLERVQNNFGILINR